MLQKDKEALYPWSVCVDDLEAFFLLMRKKLKGLASHRFVEFLDYRERLHGPKRVAQLAFGHPLELVRDGWSHKGCRRFALLALFLQRRRVATRAHGGRESGMVLGEWSHLVCAMT